MEISKKSFFAILVIVSLTSAFLGYGTYQLVAYTNSRGSKVQANVYYVFETWDGTAVYEIHNVITNIGENHTRNAFSRGEELNVTRLAVGNVSGTLQTKTALDAVYNDPTDGQYIEATIVEWLYGGDAAFNTTYKWTFEETVNLNGAASYIGNNTFAYAIANFAGGAQTFNSGENLTVRWVYKYDAND